jgi:hypothetical protein
VRGHGAPAVCGPGAGKGDCGAPATRRAPGRQQARPRQPRACPNAPRVRGRAPLAPHPWDPPPSPWPPSRLPAGGATGFAVGGYKFLAQGPAEPALSSAKLRANRLINMSGSLGRRFACASAILGLYFASFESYVYYAADGRLPDGACTSAAGERRRARAAPSGAGP